jgi:invasion protein IalB
VPSAPRPSQSINIFGSWSVQCVTRDATTQCYGETRVRETEGEARDIAVIRLVKRGDVVTASVRVPTGVLLSSPISLVFDQSRLQAAYQICGAQQCVASAELSAEFLASIAGEENMQLRFFVPGPREIAVPISLDGFLAAIANL